MKDMNKKMFFVVGLLVVLLITGCFMARNYTSKKDMIIVYNEGKEIKVLPDSLYFSKLKNEIEKVALSVIDAYDLEIEPGSITKQKNKGLSVELIFKPPREEKRILTSPRVIDRIYIPLTLDTFPYNSILVFQIKPNSILHILGARQSKDNLLKIVESLK
jgi:hypothetical protein